MKISNNFKKLWIDKKGTIEGMLEVEVVKITRYEQHEEVSINIHLKDNEEAKLLTFGPRKLCEGETVTLVGLKVSIEAIIESNQ